MLRLASRPQTNDRAMLWFSVSSFNMVYLSSSMMRLLHFGLTVFTGSMVSSSPVWNQSTMSVNKLQHPLGLLGTTGSNLNLVIPVTRDQCFCWLPCQELVLWGQNLQTGENTKVLQQIGPREISISGSYPARSWYYGVRVYRLEKTQNCLSRRAPERHCAWFLDIKTSSKIQQSASPWLFQLCKKKKKNSLFRSLSLSSMKMRCDYF